MVLPLLGILGLGAALAAKPRYEAWAEDTATRRRAQRMQGLDPGMLGGLLGRGEDPEGFNPDLYTAYSNGRTGPLDPMISPYVYNAELIRSGLLAPEALSDPHGIANIQGGYGVQQQGMSDAAAMERLRYGEGQAMDRLRFGLENQPQEPLGPAGPLDFTDPQKWTDFTNTYDTQRTAITTGEDALDFMDQYTGLGEIAPGTDVYERRAEIEQRLKLSALPIIAQDIMKSGAMSDDERPYFEQMAGGDFASMWGDARAKATFEAMLDKLADMQERQYSGLLNSNMMPAGLAGEQQELYLQQRYGLMPPMRRREREERPRISTSPIVRPYVDPRY